MLRFAPAIIVIVLGVLPGAVGQPPTPPPPGAMAWSFDEITLANGATFRGLLLSESPTEFLLKSVIRSPGRPTFTLTSKFARVDVARFKWLTEAERATLRERLAELDPDGSGERRRMEALHLALADWRGKPGAARRYDSDHFTLISDAPEEVTRRAAVRLEQIFIAFTRFLPPAVPEARPIVVMLAADQEGYRALLAPLGQTNLLHPAVYDSRSNQIVCGTELRRLGDDLQAARLHHSQQLASLATYEDGIRKLYKKPELDRYLDQVARERKRVWTADRGNGEKFDATTARLFAVLFHEAFHAYAGTFVYPPLPSDQVKAGRGTGDLPRWLNEGLAQVFETAVVEAGEVRADHADLNRLNRAKDRLRSKDRSGGLVPLADLLSSGRDAFLTQHADQRAEADRVYLTSWALAHDLTFHRRLIGTSSFRTYLIAVNSGGDPRTAFEKLVGKPLDAFEKDWHSYLLRLQSNGTVGK